MKKLILLFILFPFIMFGQTQIGSDINGESSYDQSGGSGRVSIYSDGSIVAIGAPFNDGNSTDSGHICVYNLSALLSSNSFVLSRLNIYQNPVKEQFTIQLTQGVELQKVSIYNNLGQFINATTKHIVSITNLSQGFYFVEIITNKGKATKKIIVE